MSNGRWIWFIFVIGERDSSSSRSAGFSGLPTRRYQLPSMKGFQYAGKLSISVTRLEGPTISTPHANVVGVNVMPTSVA